MLILAVFMLIQGILRWFLASLRKIKTFLRFLYVFTHFLVLIFPRVKSVMVPIFKFFISGVKWSCCWSCCSLVDRAVLEIAPPIPVVIYIQWFYAALCCEAKIVSFDDHLKASCMLNVYLSQYCRIVIQIYTFSTKTTSFIWQYEHFASQLVHQFVKLASILATTSYALVLTKMLRVHSTMCILRTHRCLSHGGQLRIPRQSTQLVLQAVLGSESQYLSDKILD